MAAKIKLIVGILIFLIVMNTAFAALKTYYVQETDLVTLTPEAFDPDNDDVHYTFPEPFDELGRWQTGLDDAGIHDIDIVASDGKLSSTQGVRIVVENKNQPPYATDNRLVVKESQKLDLKSIIVDPDEDPLEFKFQSPFDKNGVWQTDFDDEGTIISTFTASDGEFTTNHRIEIEVLHTNQPPVIKSVFSSQQIIKIKEDETLRFSTNAVDNDGESITYQWTLDGEIVSESDSGSHYFNYEDSGKHILTLIVSDGQRETIRAWTIDVSHVNRKPQLQLSPITAQEGENIVLDLPTIDLDGDALSYIFELPFNSSGEWQTNFEDAGKHRIQITANDGTLENEDTLEVTIIDVDRAPHINIPKKISVKEAEFLTWTINATDPDGDKLSYKVLGAPEGTILRNNVIAYSPTYDAIKRKGGFISNTLNKLRLEHFLLRKRTHPLTITVCGKDKCSDEIVKLQVYNVNRQPQFDTLEEITVTENEIAKLEVTATDPDGDIVHYYFTNPFNKRSGTWQTDYDDEGKHTIWVTATDGRDGNTMPVEVEVLKSNREPTLDINFDDVRVNEGQEFTLRVSATDPDEDDLEIMLEDLPRGAQFSDGAFIWAPNYDIAKKESDGFVDKLLQKTSFLNRKYNKDSETIWLRFTATDGEIDTVHPVKVRVSNVNRAPEIIDYLPEESITVGTDEPVTFHVVAEDADNEKLSYVWNFGLRQGKVGGSNTIERTFVSPGIKNVRVTVSDGLAEVTKEWNVHVIAEEIVQHVLDQDPTFKVYVIKS